MNQKSCFSHGWPEKQGLFQPQLERESCGVGFVAHMKGVRSHKIVQDAITMNDNMIHRGACGCEPDTGDGAGVFIQVPDKFLRREMKKQNVILPDERKYGTGIIFLSPNKMERDAAKALFEHIIHEEGQTFLGWRHVPVHSEILGKTSKKFEPTMEQVFIGSTISDETLAKDPMAFERRLYIIRQRVIHAVREGKLPAAFQSLHMNSAAPTNGISGFPGAEFFYITHLSSRTMIYKGMLTPEQIGPYFDDLHDEDFESALALVHSRFSTNTFPSWPRAHPNRYMAHNGEINTIMGNVNFMKARQQLCKSDIFGKEISKLFPVIIDDGSDSARFDNTLEFLYMNGYSLPHAIMMMIPEPWEHHESMSPEKKAFYEYHACLMEPWDGPASITFSDGDMIGAVLDRNGLRPSRYYVTSDDFVVMASEVGVLPKIDPAKVLKKGRLQPGRMFLVDTTQGRIIGDDEVKKQVVSSKPYKEWLEKNRITLDSLPTPAAVPAPDHETLLIRQKAFGYTFEDLKVVIASSAVDGVQPIGSMGTDIPLAVLSDKSKLMYNYFKQIFAQVTNPALDSIREYIVTGTETFLGSEQNLLKPDEKSCRMIRLHSPIIDTTELEKLKNCKESGFKSCVVPMIFDPAKGFAGFESALDNVFAQVDKEIEGGANLIILSDRTVSKERAPLPAILTSAGLHHHLVRNGKRTKVSIILETGEAREVHHFSVLIGYGADAIAPYLAFESIADLVAQKSISIPYEKGCANFLKASIKGVVKTMGKIGISTVASYRGAQIFEAIGISNSVIKKYFTGTSSRIEGIDLEKIYQESLIRHKKAYPDRISGYQAHALESGGVYKWRKEGEDHLFNPMTIHLLQSAVRTNSYETYKKYAALINDQSQKMSTLRGLMKFKKNRASIALSEVESIESIVKRFKSGAMSYGSISQEAHETLAIAMNRLGGKSNTGEGGEDASRFSPMANGDSKRSAIKQVASGRFGVTGEYLINADEIQIKISQGAKPGEGGELPGSKVYPWIAKVRHSTPGVGLVSPPPHHDIYSIEDLSELIHDLKNANPGARINVKLVAEVGVGTIAAGVAKGHADVILISGHDGGTGASPTSSIYNAGAPWELGLAETNQILLLNNLRDRVVLETDGQLKTGRDVAIAALLGAEEFGFATSLLVTLGCLMMRVCQKNTCPVGVATQDPRLRAKFQGKPEHVVNFLTYIATELREIMAELGFKTINEMVGHVELLDVRDAITHWKAAGVDLTSIFHKPEIGDDVGTYCKVGQDHGLEASLDHTTLLALCKNAIEKKEKVKAELPIINTNRVVGTTTGSQISLKYGEAGLPEDTIHLKFNGSAGQSFGAFTPKGMTLELEGDSNDYFGKGLSGAKLIVYPPKVSKFKSHENIIVGNVGFYGATSGEAYIAGVSGERFCVRNSGVETVVEGVGDHGCEYMTGGTVVVLGPTGRNFGAGMSGGIAYVYDPNNTFKGFFNDEMADLFELSAQKADEIDSVKKLIENHVKYTGSEIGKEILTDWANSNKKFKKVLPRDYARMLVCLERVKAQGLSGDEAQMAAFEENMKDLSRVGGN